MKRIQLIIFLFFATHVFAQSDASVLVGKNTVASWLQTFNFNLSSFKNPSQAYGPMARWWWPGNDVTKEELTREINLFADKTAVPPRLQTVVISKMQTNAAANAPGNQLDAASLKVITSSVQEGKPTYSDF